MSDLYDFNESWCSGKVSGVNSNCEVRFTLHIIVWRQEPNRCRQRQIRFWADPYDFNETRRHSAASGVDSNGEVRLTLHMIVWRQEPNRCRFDFGRPFAMKLGVIVQFLT